MFEYLMPSLVLRVQTVSLIDLTNELITDRQINHVTKIRLPFCMSESDYNVRDIEYTYQHSNFGIPGLGLKRSLEGNIIVAPTQQG